MPTFIGVVFFCCAIYCFFLRERSLLGLLIVASVFQAASALNFAERGIQPYYIVAAFVIARAAMAWALSVRKRGPMPQQMWLIIFGTIAIASAIILPVVFAGTPVYDPKIGLDDGLFIHPPLKLGLNNAAQAGFLAFHLATAYSVLYLGFSSTKARKAFIVAFYIVVLIVAAQSLCQFTGIPFPYKLILNNPGYSVWDADFEGGGTRNPGTFSEPSFAGGFLAMYFAAFLADYLSGKAGILRPMVALFAIALVASGGSLFTLCVVTALLLFRNFPFRPPWHVNIARTKRVALVSAILAVPVVLVLVGSSGFGQALMTNTVSKTGSDSFINRTAADLYALQLLVQTHGLGVGLGSNRASSLLTTLLSTVGIAGTLAFGIFYFRLFAKLPEQYAWLKWAALALILNMCLNIPDVTMPTLWIPILLAIQFNSGRVDFPAKLSARYVAPDMPPVLSSIE